MILLPSTTTKYLCIMYIEKRCFFLLDVEKFELLNLFSIRLDNYKYVLETHNVHNISFTEIFDEKSWFAVIFFHTWNVSHMWCTQTFSSQNFSLERNIFRRICEKIHLAWSVLFLILIHIIENKNFQSNQWSFLFIQLQSQQLVQYKWNNSVNTLGLQ